MKPSDRLKVLFILPTLSAGGAERILITLMNNLDRDRFEPEFLTLSDEGPIREWIADDITIHSFHNCSVKGSVFKLYRLIKQISPDVLFTTMVHCNALALLMKIFFPRMRVVVREAALPSVLITRYGIKGRLCMLIYKFLYRYADLVLSNCSQMIEDFENKIKIETKNHRVLFNPVDTKRIFLSMPDSFEGFDGRNKTLWFVSVGRLSYEKGYDRLIRALKDFDPGYRWRFDIIGSGDYRSILEQKIIENGLKGNVFLQGYKSNPWEYAAQADCLLLPSRWEGMPNVVLEGFACGIPAIAMEEAGGILDIQKHAMPETLHVVGTIEDFVKRMHSVRIDPKTQRVPSVLSDAFLLNRIMEQFENFLMPTVEFGNNILEVTNK